MNTKLKNFILNGLTYGIVFFILSFILGYYSFNFSLRKTIFCSVPIGIVALLIHGLIHSRFTKPLKTLQAITISLQDFETFNIEAPANHIINDHLISGKLFLTEKRLVFKSFEQEEYSWLLIHFRSFKFHPSIFNLGGEFIIQDDDNNMLVFEVDEIRLWKKSLLKI